MSHIFDSCWISIYIYIFVSQRCIYSISIYSFHIHVYVYIMYSYLHIIYIIYIYVTCIFIYIYIFIIVKCLMCKDMLFLSNRVGFEENGIQALISATDLELYHMLLEMGFWVRVQEKTW